MVTASFIVPSCTRLFPSPRLALIPGLAEIGTFNPAQVGYIRLVMEGWVGARYSSFPLNFDAVWPPGLMLQSPKGARVNEFGAAGRFIGHLRCRPCFGRMAKALT